jgi:hypothetical protein
VSSERQKARIGEVVLGCVGHDPIAEPSLPSIDMTPQVHIRLPRPEAIERIVAPGVVQLAQGQRMREHRVQEVPFPRALWPQLLEHPCDFLGEHAIGRAR